MELNQAVKHIAYFKADSALLRELGERLVGKAHIALAELVKNAYDADATRCLVKVGDDEISVIDNGHGMTNTEFLNHWMTIGTRQKAVNQGRSPLLNRPVTGSKGVGRLAAQFMAHNLEITTVAKGKKRERLVAKVNWDEAIKAEELTKAKVRYTLEPTTRSFLGDSPHGTRVVMRDLKQIWNAEDIRELGRELWMLQSPLNRFGRLRTKEQDPDDFRVKLRSEFKEVEETFDDQMRAALKNHMAVIEGRLTRSGKQAKVHVRVSFREGEQYSENFAVEPFIERANWQIRIFNLSRRQRDGISVHDARKYFARFGGVMLYDTGFRLPYYGVDQDWLGIEFDHSHRKNRSELLPERLHVRRALNDLPTQGRIFGVVDVDTGFEARSASEEQTATGEFLKIQVTRDRLVANQAYEVLKRAVRWSLDYYATRQRMRSHKSIELKKPKKPAKDALHKVRKLAQEAKDRHPQDDTLDDLLAECNDLASALEHDRASAQATLTLLGPLATAGMAALALEHETRREMQRVRALHEELSNPSNYHDKQNVLELVRHVEKWVERVDSSRRLFAPLLDMDDRESVDVLSADEVLNDVISSTKPLIAGVNLDIDVPSQLYLPPATFAEWSALFQNVLFNAANATLDARAGSIACVGGKGKSRSWIKIHDNGVGVDLSKADGLFEPFAREVDISEERRGLGLGGTGLGLTIVKMIAIQRKAKATFVKPTAPWKTTFELSWAGGTK